MMFADNVYVPKENKFYKYVANWKHLSSNWNINQYEISGVVVSETGLCFLLNKRRNMNYTNKNLDYFRIFI
jgi:hypothetical protein